MSSNCLPSCLKNTRQHGDPRGILESFSSLLGTFISFISFLSLVNPFHLRFRRFGRIGDVRLIYLPSSLYL